MHDHHSPVHRSMTMYRRSASWNVYARRTTFGWTARDSTLRSMITKACCREARGAEPWRQVQRGRIGFCAGVACRRTRSSPVFGDDYDER